MLEEFGIKEDNLAKIKSSCDEFGKIKESSLKKYDVSINAILGD
jgi:glycerol kinase